MERPVPLKRARSCPALEEGSSEFSSEEKKAKGKKNHIFFVLLLLSICL